MTEQPPADEGKSRIRRVVENARVLDDGGGDDFKTKILAAFDAPQDEAPAEQLTDTTAPARARKLRAKSVKASAPEPPDDRPDWTRRLQRDRGGQPFPNLLNTMIALREAPEFCGCFAFNEMMQSVVITAPPPCIAPREASASTRSFPHPVQDADAGLIQEWLQPHIPTLSLGTTVQSIEIRARERSFHPIRDYLDGLCWDGRERLKIWTSYHLGAEPSEYASEIGKLFLIAMVARIYWPGCKVDYLLILEGGQGARKSSFCEMLAGGPEYFSDNLPDISKTDASQHLRGKWVVELAELSHIQKSEIEPLKAFLTRTHEKYRPPYGRREVVEPRQCIFVGSTNARQYLKDETGNRRFWPLRVGEIDLDAFKADRDQLLAEAAHLFKQGARWWPDFEFEQEHIKREQDLRVEIDPWEGPILDYLNGMQDQTVRNSVQIRNVGCEAVKIPIQNFGTSDRNRITAILRKNGWEPGNRTGNSRPWVRPGHA